MATNNKRVANFLTSEASCGPEVVSIFEEEDVDWETFLELTESDFKDLGVKLGPRKRIARALKGSPTTQNVAVKVRDATVSMLTVGTQTPLAFEAYSATLPPAFARSRSSSGAWGMSPSLAPRDYSQFHQNQTDAVIVVDPVSTGANLADQLIRRGLMVIRVFSRYMPPAVQNFVAAGLRADFVATIEHDIADPEQTIEAVNLLPYNVVAVFSGSELGVELTDWLSESLQLRTNGTDHTILRRDKYQMGEAVRASGVPACAQARASHWHEIEQFLEEENFVEPFKVIIKPIRSAGSDSVSLCTTVADLKEKFDNMIGKVNQLGISNLAVVVQEFLEGDEYVVDTVSRDGVHKMAAIWKYDKRPANGADFIYFGMSIVDGASQIGRALFEYQKQVLDALGIVNGPGHGEVMWTPNKGPILIEVGARPHGSEGTFMEPASRAIGYNQVSLSIDAYLDEKAFLAHPDIAETKYGMGAVIDLVSYKEGKLVKYGEEEFERLKTMPSFIQYNCLPKVGDQIPITVDMFTAVGSLTLFHQDKEQLALDIEKIREAEQANFFVLE